MTSQWANFIKKLKLNNNSLTTLEIYEWIQLVVIGHNYKIWQNKSCTNGFEISHRSLEFTISYLHKAFEDNIFYNLRLWI